MNKMWVEWGVRNQILGILIKSVGDVQGKDNHTNAFYFFFFFLNCTARFLVADDHNLTLIIITIFHLLSFGDITLTYSYLLLPLFLCFCYHPFLI